MLNVSYFYKRNSKKLLSKEEKYIPLAGRDSSNVKPALA
jgi:hypothetical protein